MGSNPQKRSLGPIHAWFYLIGRTFMQNAKWLHKSFVMIDFVKPLPGPASRSGNPLGWIFALVACSVLLAGMAASPAGATPTLVAGDQVSLVGIEGDFPNPHPGA